MDLIFVSVSSVSAVVEKVSLSFQTRAYRFLKSILIKLSADNIKKNCFQSAIGGPATLAAIFLMFCNYLIFFFAGTYADGISE